MKTLRLTDAQFDSLAESAAAAGLECPEDYLGRLLRDRELARRRAWAAEVEQIREKFTSRYPSQSDSVTLIREDRNR